MKLNCKTLVYGSEEQLKSLALRREILRKPLGLDFTPEDLAGEELQTNIGCFMNTEIAGILLLKSAGPAEMKMRQVAVANNLQGKGIGKAMVHFAEQWCLGRGIEIISLHARENAVDFYTGLNYQTEGEVFLEVGIPHFYMKKVLI